LTGNTTKSKKKRKVAWGITGSGDKLEETLRLMKLLRAQYEEVVEVQVFVSKAGEQVLRHYGLLDELRGSLSRVFVEVDANTPFLAGWLQTGRFEFLLIAPATSNTVAKISAGIADTMLTNAAILALKALVPVHVLPSDYEEGILYTKLPSGREMKLKIRKEDAENVRKLKKMENVSVLEKPSEISEVFVRVFGKGSS
jgi:archaeoflavoprotein AfpA